MFSAHITNLNKILKNIKSEVIANFIHIDQASIIIVTSKVVLLLSSSNNQEIHEEFKQY